MEVFIDIVYFNLIIIGWTTLKRLKCTAVPSKNLSIAIHGTPQKSSDLEGYLEIFA